jgi:hypothetical protein
VSKVTSPFQYSSQYPSQYPLCPSD